MFQWISHQPGRVRGSHLVRLVWKDQAVILSSLIPVFISYNSARKNPNTSANPQHLDLFPVLSGTLPFPLDPPPSPKMIHSTYCSCEVDRLGANTGWHEQVGEWCQSPAGKPMANSSRSPKVFDLLQLKCKTENITPDNILILKFYILTWSLSLNDNNFSESPY